MRHFYTFYVLVGMCLAGMTTHAQSLRKQADKAYTHLQYAIAIDLYEQVLHQKKPEKRNVLPLLKNLADSYQKTNDSKNAERVYKKVVEQAPSDTLSVLAYAQTLAGNGKYDEARAWYSTYQQLQPHDSRGSAFANAYANMLQFYADSARYTLFSTNLSSPQADFSPAYQGKKLIFVSGRPPVRGSSRIYARDQSSFLDLYTIDTTQIRFKPYQTDKGVDTYTDADSYERRQRQLHTDESTQTSNDNATLGYFSSSTSKSSDHTPAHTAVKPLDEKLNTPFHEGPAVCTKDGTTIYFTRNNYTGSPHKSTDRVIKLKIYTSTRKDTTSPWSSPEELPFTNKNYSVGHPALSSDEKTLYFVSDMPGGVGGTDIYKVTKESDGTWGIPENLGKTINTEGNEMFPTVTFTNKLYFSSNGHAGLGGLDIFETDLSSRSAVKNLGYPVNSRKDDFGCLFNPKTQTGYFSSNRTRGVGGDDIYLFRQVFIPIQYVVYGYENKNIQDTLPEVTMTLTESNKTTTRLPGKNRKGVHTFVLKPDANYTLTAKRGDVTVTKTITTEGLLPGERITDALQFITDSLSVAIILPGKKKRLGKDSLTLVLPSECEQWKNRYTLPIVYYNYDEIALRPEARLALGTVINLMKKEPDIELILSSYTDSRGVSDPYNKNLSAQRTEEVYQYLVNRGIPDGRLIKESYGERAPVNECKDGIACTEVKHQFNRRTEFQVIKAGRNITRDCELIRYALPNQVDSADVRLIYFDLDKADIRLDAATVLTEIALTLQTHPTYKLSAASFTDSRATQAYNYSLSQRRLKASVDYLVTKGVEPSRILTREFFGESRLANDCRDEVYCTEEQHQANRRTEFRLIKD